MHRIPEPKGAVIRPRGARVLFSLIVGVALGWGFFWVLPEKAPPLPILADVGEWSLLDDNGQPFGSKELAGKVWVANFIFTRCLASCPVITAALREVEKSVEHDVDKVVHFVSFTVDPEYDQPAVLAAYRKKRALSSSRWSFVTGKTNEVHRVLRKKMFSHIGDKVIRGDVQDGLVDIAHLQRLALFDKQGRLRATASIDDEGQRLLLAQIERLQAE